MEEEFPETMQWNLGSVGAQVILVSANFIIHSFCMEPDEPMDMSLIPEGGEHFQKLQDDEAVDIEKPLLPSQPAVSPQASTPVSRSTPVFTPASLPIPSQPEFSHVSFARRVPISSCFSFPSYLVGQGCELRDA